jgi:hypothetical protein
LIRYCILNFLGIAELVRESSSWSTKLEALQASCQQLRANYVSESGILHRRIANYIKDYNLF